MPDQCRTRRQLDETRVGQPCDSATSTTQPARFVPDRGNRPAIVVVVAEDEIDGPRDPAGEFFQVGGETRRFPDVAANENRIDAEASDAVSEIRNSLPGDEVEVYVSQPGGAVDHAVSRPASPAKCHHSCRAGQSSAILSRGEPGLSDTGRVALFRSSQLPARERPNSGGDHRRSVDFSPRESSRVG